MSKILQLLQKKFPLEKNTKESPIIIIDLDGTAINHISDEVKTYLENFKSLEELSLVNCNLNSLQNFPELPSLKKLDLSDNHLKDTDLKELCKYTKLQELRMANNNGIKDFSEIKILEPLPLNFIDFSDCPISKTAKYRDNFYENFKNLKVLDFFDKDGKEWEEDDEEEEEADDDDNGFIDDDLKNDNNEEKEKDEDDNNNGEQYEDDDEDKEEEYEEENEEEEIKNPNPAKKKKLE